VSGAAPRLTAALADRYRIERELGAGGMATVYLAEDLKHDRKVAIKVLKPELAAVLGAERFVQEIKTTAALSHPHILPLFDSGEAGGFLYYVMPYIEGETIRDRLNRETQLGVEETVRITTEVADALDYAHRHGVIHRDIKPENILLHDGRAMVMDFGIALAVSAAAGGRLTETGLSLGTPHYMSPEQATADKDITARSDVYSLASVLYEMLAGVPPHEGGSAQQTIMRIITETPKPVSELRRSVPPNVSAATAKALEKLPADRFESAKAFADALVDRHFTIESTGAPGATAATASDREWIRNPRSIGALLLAAVATVFAVIGRSGSASARAQVVRFTVPAVVDSSVFQPSFRGGVEAAEPVVSPDGRHLAFAVSTFSGPRLVIRSIESGESRFVEGGGFWPFFSAGGDVLGFFREGSEIWKLDLTDDKTVPTKVVSIPEREWDLSGAAWDRDGRMFVSASKGIWVIAAGGGSSTLFARSDSGQAFRHVGILPDGRLLVDVLRGDREEMRVVSVDGKAVTPAFPGLERVRIVDDVIFYLQEDALHAARFDPGRMRPPGEGIVLEPADRRFRVGRSIARQDVRGLVTLEPLWVTRAGQVSPTGLPANMYRWPRLSPDTRRMAFGILGDDRVNVIDLQARTTYRMQGRTEPTWAPDGRSLYMSLGNRPHGGLGRQVPDGSRPIDTLVAFPADDAWPTDVSRDGRWLAWYGAGDSDSGNASDPNDLDFMDLTDRQSRRVVIAGSQKGPRFSRDGRWVAYQSTESGASAIHVRPWPTLDANYVVSDTGATEPAWSPDGRELYYRQGNSFMAVSLSLADSGTLRRTEPRELFRGNYPADQYGDQSYDVAPDGRFLLLRAVRAAPVDISVTLNWIEEIRARLDRQAGQR